eukprot:TRINITY_DN1750_c0_g1_i16.p1 TRINITY_DN1750_c0_g1~~TRINITY_DN1750_c0_g1_i16.p1  ORF type:complete len:640 (-),score=217.22 TRINITY_DN1750_c0_g1_i16:241-2160(-)
MRWTVFLLAIMAKASAAPAKNENPDSEVELVQPVENDPTEGSSETEDDTVVIVVGPGSSEEPGSFGGFGFGDLPGIGGSFNGFGERRPGVQNIDLSSLFGDSETKINLGDFFGSDDESSVTLSVSLEPVEDIPQATFSDSLSGVFGEGSPGQGFSLTDLMEAISSRNQQPQNSNVGGGGFGFGNRRPQFGLGGFGTRNQRPGGFGTRNQHPGGFSIRNQRPSGFGSRNQNQGTFNLEGFLGNRNRQPQNSFADIFGSVSLKPQFSLSDIIGSVSGGPQGFQHGSPSLGIFGGLTGKPWTSFRNIFGLYNRPEARGYKQIFGPVYGHRGGCGLCQLFPSDNLPVEGATVTLEIVSDTPDYVYGEPDTDYEILEEETIPGGSVVRVNETAIRVLDENGEGIYFLLNTDTESEEGRNETEMKEDDYNEYDQYDNEPEDGGTIDENLPTVDDVKEDGEKDYKMIDGEDSIEYGDVDENTDDGNSNTDENTPTEDDNNDGNNKEYDETTDSTFETADVDLIDDDESVTDLSPDMEVTTPLDGPAVFNEGRFDIANDKIVDEKIDDPVDVNTETNKEIFPDTDTDTDITDESETVEEEADISTDPNPQEGNTTPMAVTNFTDETDTTESQTSPTLGIDNIDEGLL